MAASSHLSRVCLISAIVVGSCALASANWLETFGGNAYDQTWTFGRYPVTGAGTFSANLIDGGGGDYFLSLDEGTALLSGGSAFGMGFCKTETFSDVRVGALVNMTGNDSHNYFGIAARANSFDPGDGSTVVGGAYLLLYHWEDGPTRVRIELVKVANNADIRLGSHQPEFRAPGIDHARSHYLELDIVGSDPVYITGSIYSYKGGPLLARTPVLVDTNGQDPWEASDYGVYASGESGVFAINEAFPIPGYHSTFDTVSSTSEGPAAVNLSPVDGATNVSIDADLSWVEASFATSRQLWFGEQGAMQMVTPAGATYDPGTLKLGKTYQWRVDQVGASGSVAGRTWTFTTPEGLVVDDIEGYKQTSPDKVFETWVDGWDTGENGSVVGYTSADPCYTETGTVYEGDNSMPFAFNTVGAVNYAEATAETAKLDIGQDWTRAGVTTLTLSFRRSQDNNDEQQMYIRLSDGVMQHTVLNPYPHAPQAQEWEQWNIALSEFSDAGVDLASVDSMTIGFGDKTLGRSWDGQGKVFIDAIMLYPPRCFNKDGLDLQGDTNGDCKIDFQDITAISAGWLNDGLSALP